MTAEEAAFATVGLFECSSQGKSNDSRHFQRDIQKA